jgi:NAD(P)-dependent dehydrogenase (short-subunit alcohol dehydrogenase family)
MTASNAHVALVTGANRGLGLETCRQLLERGARVVMTGRDERVTQRARDGLDPGGQRAIAVRMDVTEPASILAAQRTIEREVGAVDILVNNAAVLLFESTDVLAIPEDGFRRTFDANLFGAIEVCRVFAPPMAARGFGRIVNLSSRAGQLATMSTYAPAYSISKAALNGFTRILAATYKHRGVLANAVDPGWVRTDMGGPSAPRSVQQGADTIVWLATLPKSGPTGGFFHDRRPIEW